MAVGQAHARHVLNAPVICLMQETGGNNRLAAAAHISFQFFHSIRHAGRPLCQQDRRRVPGEFRHHLQLHAAHAQIAAQLVLSLCVKGFPDSRSCMAARFVQEGVCPPENRVQGGKRR